VDEGSGLLAVTLVGMRHAGDKQPLAIDTKKQHGYEDAERDDAPSSPCCIYTVFNETTVPALHLGGEDLVVACSSNRLLKTMQAHRLTCSVIVWSVLTCGCAALLSDFTTGSLACDFLIVDLISTVFNAALVVGICTNLFRAFQLNLERRDQARVARAQWVRHNTQLSPAVIMDRRRLLFLGACFGDDCFDTRASFR